MLCFVDESGDTGLKVGGGSSRYFTVALVLFPDNKDAIACDQRIGLLRRELGVNKDFEFHFIKTPKRIKEAFFNAVVPYNFFYLTITINKAALYGQGFRYKNSFYKYTCRLLFESAKPHLDRAIVVFDGSGSRAFKRELEQYLKKQMNEEGVFRIQQVKVQDSSSNNLIQLADMVCGAVAQTLKLSQRQEIQFHRIISHRELSCQVWPTTTNEWKKQVYEEKKKSKKPKRQK